jgi:hypothetical protein
MPHLVSCLDEVHLRHNLNGTLVNLGGNGQGLQWQHTAAAEEAAGQLRHEPRSVAQLTANVQPSKLTQGRLAAAAVST